MRGDNMLLCSKGTPEFIKQNKNKTRTSSLKLKVAQLWFDMDCFIFARGQKHSLKIRFDELFSTR